MMNFSNSTIKKKIIPPRSRHFQTDSDTNDVLHQRKVGKNGMPCGYPAG